MPYIYTNRKGLTNYLCQTLTKNGKTRYYFAREPKNATVEKMPDGYQVDESVNGIVSMVKARPQLIFPEELVSVEVGLKKLPQSHKYQATIKNDQIVIYESRGADMGEVLSGFLGWKIPASFSQEFNESHAQFGPIMRFILEDPERRIFSAQRWCFRGSIDDWINVWRPDIIEILVKELLPKLGMDSFYELY